MKTIRSDLNFEICCLLVERDNNVTNWGLRCLCFSSGNSVTLRRAGSILQLWVGELGRADIEAIQCALATLAITNGVHCAITLGFQGWLSVESDDNVTNWGLCCLCFSSCNSVTLRCTGSIFQLWVGQLGRANIEAIQCALATLAITNGVHCAITLGFQGWLSVKG